MAVPYAWATTGGRARDEIKKILERFGCEKIGFMDDLKDHAVILAFEHRGRAIQLRASAKGYAQLYLKANPWTSNRRTPRVEYEQAALKQGHIAVNSMLRDLIKGHITAIECGIVSFEAVFMPYMLTADGRPLIERLAETNQLPSPEGAKVVQLK